MNQEIKCGSGWRKKCGQVRSPSHNVTSDAGVDCLVIKESSMHQVHLLHLYIETYGILINLSVYVQQDLKDLKFWPLLVVRFLEFVAA